MSLEKKKKHTPDGDPKEISFHSSPSNRNIQVDPYNLLVAAQQANVTDYDLLASSDLFDSKWYLDNYKDVASTGGDPIEHYLRFGAKEGRNPGPKFNTNQYLSARAREISPEQNPLVHYILHGAPEDIIDTGMLKAFSPTAILTGMTRLEKCPLFSPEDYGALNSDLNNQNVNRVNHAMVYGFSEGRQVFRKDIVARVLGEVSRELPSQPLPWGRRAVPRLPKIGVFYNSEGNEFIKELASDLVESLCLVGQNAILLNEQADMRTRPELCIFTAPHEFFYLGRGKSWIVEDIIKSAIMFNTEQPQTLWFERGMPFILLSKGVIDICHQICKLLEVGGVPAIHFNSHIGSIKTIPLTQQDQEHSLIKVLPEKAKRRGRRDSPITERAIDISFFGTSSDHRETFFLRNASFLANYECFLYYRKFSGPITNSSRDAVLTRLPQHVAMHSKISLNIHRDDFGFFEWHRIVQLGLVCGSTVVSEPCLPHPYFKPDLHFFEESGRHIPNLIEWLLKSPEGIMRAEKARTAVASLMNDKVTARNSTLSLVAFLARMHEGIA